MANVKKIKLPNNTTVDIIDSRIPGVDTTVTSESSNVVTSGAVYTAISNSQAAAENAKSITYSNLKTAKTGGNLVPGTWYRITDYVATTIDTESRSASHPFDIIVLAESTNTLSEEGFAALHSGDTYFASSKLEAWKVWYCLDNDTTRFAWADSTNGKGVVYRLIDEFNNDVPYDFKGIQFKRYAVTADSTYTASIGQLNGLCIGCSVAPKGFTITSGTYDWYYTFTLVGNSLSGTKTDASLTKKAHDVTFAYYVQRNTLLNNVFIDGDAVETLHTQLGLTLSAADYDVVAANCTFSDATYNLTLLGDICHSESNETQVRNNLFVGSFRHNVFKSDFQENTIVGDYIFNTAQLYDNVIFVTNGMARNNIEALWSNYIYVNGDVYYNRGTRICNNTIVITASTSNAIFGNNFGVQFDYNTISAQFSYNSCQYNNTYNTINAKVIGCTFNTLQFGHNTINTPVASSVFAGPVEYVDIPQVSDKYFAFAHVGALRGSSSSHIKLGYSDFFTASVSGIVNQWTFTTNDDGQIVATRKTDDGVDTGVYASSAESVSGTWHNIPADAGGTVTSVAMTVPTGLSVSGSPITTNGTLAVSLASGYSIPTTTKQSEWDGKADKVTSATNGDFAGLDSNGNLTDSGKKDSDFVHTSGNESIAGNKSFSGSITLIGENKGIALDQDGQYILNTIEDGFDWIQDEMGDSVQDYLDAKQATLVSGTNIKTVNNQSLLGSGNISISGGGGGINGVKENGTALTPDANGVVDVTVPTKTYVIETDYEHWDENSYTITTQMFDAIVDDALEGRSVVLRFHIIGSDEGYNEVCDYALTYSSSSNNYWALQFNELRGGNSGRVLFLSKEGGTVQHVLYSYTFEMVGNRVTSISSYSTNYTYPTAKAVYDSVKNLAPKASPALTGTPTAPTATAGTNTTQIATTAFVQSAFTDSRTIAAGNWTFDDTNVWFDGGSYLISHYTNSADFSWIKNQTGSDSSSTYITLQDALDAKQATLVSGTNIKTINNESILGSGNISVGGGGSTTDCVHKTGDETVGGDKTFTDDIAVVDASHIKYSGGGGGGGFTKGVTSAVSTSTASISFSVSGEPKAFVMSFRNASAATASTAYIIAVVGDSTGTHAVYTTGTQNNYSSGFTTSYSNGNFTITAPTGISFPGGGLSYSLVYYYGSGTLTFKTAQVQPGSGATSVTFTDANLTEMPEMYATMLENQVNNESYRRVSLYTNAGSDGLGDQQALGVSFFSSNIYDTTSSFTATYQTGYSAGLNINSGGTNAGGYFHNPGTYTLYYLMASDIGGGGGSYQSLAAELSAITTDISALETGKQDTLVSGTSIKTINSTSLLGSGNIAISSLPTVTTTNNGQLLEVSNGAWAAGRTITISSSEPTAYQGNNGDIWIVI